MAENKKTSADSKPIQDVEKPGKTAASPTSKAVLVTNRPIMKDPMVTDNTETQYKQPESDESFSVPVSKGSTRKIQPLETSPKPDDLKTDDSSVPEAEPEAVAEPEPETKTEPEATTPEPTKSESTSEESSKEPAKKLKSPDEDEDTKAAQQAEHDANLQKIVDAKTYYLPINAVEKRKTKRFVVLGLLLSVVLILAWVDIALDAGLISINGVSSVTHFFSS